MSLQIVTGGSGSGKSTAVYQRVIEASRQNPKRNYFVIVPDQFTMQTQMDLVTMSDCGGIMNIDVLSLNRLAHRIFEETGGARKPVLDDTGKSLVLRKIAGDLKEQIPVLGSNLDKQGYIHEVKSAISEFMQYGIGCSQLEELTEYAKQRGALYYKLKDLQVLYQGFLNYISENYITTEELMDILAQELYRSQLIKDSVVVFDGFTGFTPIQMNVIGTLMELCKQVVVTITIDGAENPDEEDGEQKLFFFAKKTVRGLKKEAQKRHVVIEPDIRLQEPVVKRYEGKEELAFLEKNLFRYPLRTFPGKTQQQIQLSGYEDIRMEIRNTCLKIRSLLNETSCAYRDIALIVGDLASYESEIEEMFMKYSIPVFIDKTRGIELNPFIELIKASFDIILENFSFESVFHYLRSGLADFTMEETDALENYVLELGIRGKKAWSHTFAKRTKQMKKQENALQNLELFNEMRERLLEQLSPLLTGTSEDGEKEMRLTTKFTVRELIERLYGFLVKNNVEQKLFAYQKMFEEQKDDTRAREYAQIYRLIMELLDQIMELIGEEEMNIREFADILEAGFGEIEVGTIPQGVDRVIVGDMERTRLKPVKYLFFLGLNDGFIPKNASKGGIISDIDREFLTESNMELAPSPRQQMYIQKYYLYLNLTKPSEKLFLSYAGMDLAGKTIRPSYLVATIEKMFPQCKKEEKKKVWAVGNEYEAKEYVSSLMRKYVDDTITDEEKTSLEKLLTYFSTEESGKIFLENIIAKGFSRYHGSNIERAAAVALYGETILSSVSRMEQYASCAYSYFLRYGLSLQERELYGFEDRDIGTIFHDVLEMFAAKLGEKGYTWFDFPKNVGEEIVSAALEEVCLHYTDALLFDRAVTRYSMMRMKRILNRAVNTISYQLQKGKMKPESFELSFSVTENLNDIDVTLSEREKMKLSGRIDRIDTYEDDEHIYVKVVDYKSGNKDFNLTSFYKGTQLQLVVYMNEAIKEAKVNHPGKEPVRAALLYYHVADPMVTGEDGMNDEMINQKIIQELRSRGIVNSEANVIEILDASKNKKSDCIPIEYKADGSFSASSDVMTDENMKLLSDFATYRLKSIGVKICRGEIPINPCTQGKKDACTYCAYQAVCGFDTKIPGYEKTEILEEDEEELFRKMKEEMEGEA